MTSFFYDLEDQLRTAAHQRTAGAQAPDHAPPPASRRRSRGRWAWLADGARAVPVALAVAVTLITVGGALILLGHHGGRSATPPASEGPGNAFATLVQNTPQAQLRREFKLITAASSKVGKQPACRPPTPQGRGIVHGIPSQALLSAVGVLRRPATPVDRVDLHAFGLGEPGLTIYGDGVRRALTTSSDTYYIVPAHIAASGAFPTAGCLVLQKQALRQALPTIPARLRAPTLALQAALMDYDRRLSASRAQDGVCVLRMGRGTRSSQCGEPLSAIQRPLIPSDDNGTFSAVVPDGVATVTITFRATASHAARSVTGVVHNNMYVVRAPGIPLQVANEPTVVWRAANGTELKHFTPPSPRALKKLCLNHPERCATTMVLEGSSSSGVVRAAKLNPAVQAGAGAPQRQKTK